MQNLLFYCAIFISEHWLSAGILFSFIWVKFSTETFTSAHLWCLMLRAASVSVGSWYVLGAGLRQDNVGREHVRPLSSPQDNINSFGTRSNGDPKAASDQPIHPSCYLSLFVCVCSIMLWPWHKDDGPQGHHALNIFKGAQVKRGGGGGGGGLVWHSSHDRIYIGYRLRFN